MRRLVRCSACPRQYDATRRPVASVFRCRCGASVEVPKGEGHDAAVVSCRSCGGTRAEGAPACGYCGSDFTIHEQDLHTICPACFARISDRARFCHHCATPILPEEDAGEATERPCPACGDAQTLRSRVLDKLTALECTRCAGLWLGEETFRLLGDRAREDAQPFPDARAVKATMAKARQPIARQTGAMYRPCPACGERMARSNFGRSSGVVLDRCPGHGFWFDAHELDAALAWVKIGGERQAAEEQKRHERERASLDRLRVQPKVPEEETGMFATTRTSEKDWLMSLFQVVTRHLRS